MITTREELPIILQEGEGYRIELKERVSDLDREMVAFANASGGLVKGLTLENFGKISMLRNPDIANLLQRIDYIEKMGTGIERIKLSLKKAGIPDVTYKISQAFFKAIFTRVLSTTQEKILCGIRSNPAITRGGLAKKQVLPLTE